MRRLILLLMLTFPFSHLAWAEKRVALVIGNANYVAADALPNDLNDAEDMANVLRGYGFQVIKKTDASLSETVEALDQFGQELADGGVGVFYYSGHGLEVDGRQYIMPVDAELEGRSKLKYEMLEVNDILQKVGEGNARFNLIILDACRDNPFAKSLGLKSLSKGFSPIQGAPSGTLIASATATGSTSSAEGDRNSVYTAHLLRLLRENPTDEVRLLLGDVGDAVKNATNNTQIPWTSGAMSGRFYFQATNEAITPATPVADNSPPSVAPAASVEQSVVEAPASQNSNSTTSRINAEGGNLSSFNAAEMPATTETQPALESEQPPDQDYNINVGSVIQAMAKLEAPISKDVPAATGKAPGRYQTKDGIVLDTLTGLIWMRCSLGQEWDGATCQGQATNYKWDDAIKTAQSFSYADYNGWRVPTLTELKSLVYCGTGGDTQNLPPDAVKCEGNYSKPTIFSSVFLNTPQTWFWSSTPDIDGDYVAWAVTFGNGKVYGAYADSLNAVRLVRTGQ